jgi:hypothetical protein
MIVRELTTAMLRPIAERNTVSECGGTLPCQQGIPDWDRPKALKLGTAESRKWVQSAPVTSDKGRSGRENWCEVQSESNSSHKPRRQSLLAVVLIEATILVAAGVMCALILVFQSDSRAAITYPAIFFVGVNILGWISYARSQNQGSKK